ncbi:MAG: molybdenum cofactor guanylyltransferase [Acidobacteriota bacterium]
MGRISDRPFLLGRLASLTGHVLAGGPSQRMGCSKAMLTVEGETMLERQIRLLRVVASGVMIVGGSPKYAQKFDVPMVQDVVSGRGPLAGIYTALLQTRTEFNLVLGCDLPFVNSRLLGYLASRAVASGSDVTVPRSRDGLFQPLCAVYRRRALHAVRASLAAGRNKVSNFFPKVRCAAIPWSDLARAGFKPSIFDNMNTPEDYECVRRRLEGSTATFA